jgi:hypothetical protein
MVEDAEAMHEAVQWPVPFHQDQNGWPVTRFSFYDKENQIWPISIFKPAIGEMRFINWCMSFLADKVAANCHTYVAVLKSAGATIQKQINGSNAPFTVIEIAEALGIKNINEAVSFLQAPNFPGDIWKMLAEVGQRIKEKTGVTELLQGMTSRSMRSAAEAQIRNERVSVRPDDMAARCEDALGEVAVREMQTARWFCGPEDMEPRLGKMGAMVWQNYVMTADPADVVLNFDYRVEAGSTRKPNIETKIAQLTEMGQYALPVFQQFAASGQVEPYNAFITEMCKAQGIDPRPFLVQPPQPPDSPSPEEQQAQADMELKMREFELSIAEMQAKLGMEQQSQQQELTHAEEMHRLEMEQRREEMKLKQQESKAKSEAMKIAARNKPAKGATSGRN